MCTIEPHEGYIPFVFNIKLEFKSSACSQTGPRIWKYLIKLQCLHVYCCIIKMLGKGYRKDRVELDVNTKRASTKISLTCTNKL